MRLKSALKHGELDGPSQATQLPHGDTGRAVDSETLPLTAVLGSSQGQLPGPQDEEPDLSSSLSSWLGDYLERFLKIHYIFLFFWEEELLVTLCYCLICSQLQFYQVDRASIIIFLI